MPERNKATPAEIMADRASLEQQLATSDFAERAQKKINALAKTKGSLRTSEGTYHAYAVVSERAQLSGLTKLVEGALTKKNTCTGIDIDKMNIFEGNPFSIDGAFPLQPSVISEAVEEGRQNGTNGFFDLLAPVETYSFGEVATPFIRWRRDLAEKYIGGFIEEEDGGYASLSTVIPGVEVGFNYCEDEKIPTREIIIFSRFKPL